MLFTKKYDRSKLVKHADGSFVKIDRLEKQIAKKQAAFDDPMISSLLDEQAKTDLLKSITEDKQLLKQVKKAADDATLGVVIQHTTQRWHPSPDFVYKGTKQGWITMADGKLTVKNLEGDDAVFLVIREPGHYCCHCDEKMPNQQMARAHVSEEHDGVPSPDVQKPAGYRQDNFYACVLFGSETGVTNHDEAIVFDKKAREAFNARLGAKYRKHLEGVANG